MTTTVTKRLTKKQEILDMIAASGINHSGDHVPTAIYGDGGVLAGLEANSRSEVAATWACCHVNAYNERIWMRSGIIVPMHGFDTVTSNMSEYKAIMVALHELPDGWSGTVNSDSELTIFRCTYPYQPEFWPCLPAHWCAVMRAEIARMGALTWIHLKGHPNPEDLRAGKNRSGLPVSVHNAWCDLECQKRKAEVQEASCKWCGYRGLTLRYGKFNNENNKLIWACDRCIVEAARCQ